jgi:tetratricopeptide (TPR) repeat protein
MKSVLFILSAGLLLAGGCASSTPSSAAMPTTLPIAAASAAPADAGSPRAFLKLDQIQPVPVLPAEPTSRPADPTPSRALQLFARGLDALWNHQPYEAVDAFREALKLDPFSFELNDEMGRAQLERMQLPTDASFQAFEMASALRPGDMQMHLLLARQYLSAGNAQKALDHLRLALLTDDYHNDAPGSGPVELFLARALEQLGYDQAAVDAYQLVSARIANPTSDMFRDPDMSYAVSAPHLIMLQEAQIYERLGQYDNALTLYESLAETDPATFVLQAQVVRMLVRLGRTDEAIGRAADIVTLFGASSESLILLHDTCYGVSPKREVDVLKKLHDDKPQDRGILFALSDALIAINQSGDARQLLAGALTQSPDDTQIVGKLFKLEMNAGDSTAAAQLLITQLAAQPDELSDLSPMIAELLRPATPNSLRPAQIQKLQVPDYAQAAKLSVVAEAADLWRRDALQRSSIEAAVKLSPPFPPAYRRFIIEQWARQDLSEDQKIEVSDKLAQQAETGGNPALAAELRGLSFAYQGKLQDSADALETAMRLDPDSADLQLTYAAVLAKQKRTLECEQTLWKIVAKWPQNDSAWSSLYDFYEQTNRDPEAIASLVQWLKADPASPDARVLEARWSATHGQEQFALGELAELLHDHSDDLQLITKIEAAYIAINHGPDFVNALVAIRREQPTNLTVVSILADILAHSGRPDIALALLDETRQHVAHDADMLYEVSWLYHETGQVGTSEDVLKQVLQVDPNNAAANNDLGFAWADEGKNLPEADKMIRIAVAAEPDNEAFLDSLGWVLYKQARYDEAVQYFKQAIGDSPAPDAEILDHYGDNLYRLGQQRAAIDQWKRAMIGLGQNNPEDEDAGSLKQKITEKLRDAEAGKPVDTAPIGAQPPSTQP